MYFKYTSQSSYTVAIGEVDYISNEIIKTANQVYIYGKDTQVKLSINIPKEVISIRFNNSELIFNISVRGKESTETSRIADVNFSSFGKITTTPGRKNIIVKSLGDTILVNTECKETELSCAVKQDFTSCTGSYCKLKCVNGAWSIINTCSQCPC